MVLACVHIHIRNFDCVGTKDYDEGAGICLRRILPVRQQARSAIHSPDFACSCVFGFPPPLMLPLQQDLRAVHFSGASVPLF